MPSPSEVIASGPVAVVIEFDDEQEAIELGTS